MRCDSFQLICGVCIPFWDCQENVRRLWDTPRKQISSNMTAPNARFGRTQGCESFINQRQYPPRLPLPPSRWGERAQRRPKGARFHDPITCVLPSWQAHELWLCLTDQPRSVPCGERLYFGDSRRLRQAGHSRRPPAILLRRAVQRARWFLRFHVLVRIRICSSVGGCFPCPRGRPLV
jgi:hypothetical protein